MGSMFPTHRTPSSMKPNLKPRLASAALTTTLAVCLSGTAFASDWVGDVSGDWNDDANWSGDAGTGGTNAIINLVGTDGSAPYTATITANIVATPVDIFVGNGVGATGLLNHRAGSASTGGGNWMFIGREGGTGTYNLADTTTAGAGVSGWAQGSGSMTVGGRLYVGGWGTSGYGEANINTTGTLALGTMLQVGENGGTGVFNMESGTVTIGTATEAAEALRPLAGDLAYVLFAAGIIGTGLLAVPVLAGASAYAVAETVGMQQGLGRSLGQARGFYAVIAASTLIGMSVHWAGVDPIRALYYAAALNGLVAPPLMALMRPRKE